MIKIISNIKKKNDKKVHYNLTISKIIYQISRAKIINFNLPVKSIYKIKTLKKDNQIFWLQENFQMTNHKLSQIMISNHKISNKMKKIKSKNTKK